MTNKKKNNIKRKKVTSAYRVFEIFNITFLLLLGLLCFVPFIHIIALSFSSSFAASAGRVVLWPVEFSMKSFRFITRNSDFIRAFGVSIERVAIGVPINMVLLIFAAYPLSKSKNKFIGRQFYVVFFFITMIFYGGLIPTYIIIGRLKLLDKIWALVLPSAMNVFNLIILLNFFRQLPPEIEESAHIDGAGYSRILWQIIVPLSKPALATLTLFSIMYHWNSWFDGLIYMNNPDNYPLQSYMQTLMSVRNFSKITKQDLELLKSVSDKTANAGRIVIATIPVLLVYPFLQKYFAKGIVLGSVKG